MPSSRILVFDFDGTLADTNALKRDAYVEVFARHGIESGVVAMATQDCPEEDRLGVIREVLGRAGRSFTRQDVGRLAEAYGAICERGAIERPEVPGAEAAIATLSQIGALYVNSATPEVSLRRILACRGWLNYFRGVMGRPHTKAENLERVLRRETVSADQLVMIGDSPVDRDAAVHVGCRFIAVSAFPRELLRDDEPWIQDLHELPAVVDRLWSVCPR